MDALREHLTHCHVPASVGRAPSAQGDGPSTIDLTHDAEYGAPRLLV
jgi:hypothetical protein